VTSEQVLFGVGLVVVLAVGSQVLAGRLRIPALIILLPVGVTAGALTTDVNPQRLLGAAFQPLVSLAVAVILYHAGLGLDLARLRGHTRRVVLRLIAVGAGHVDVRLSCRALGWAAPWVGRKQPSCTPKVGPRASDEPSYNGPRRRQTQRDAPRHPQPSELR